MPEQVEHQGSWWHRKDDGSIHRHVNGEWVRWSPGDEGSPPPTWFGTAPPPPGTAPIAQSSFNLSGVIGVLVLIGLIVAVFSWCSSTLESTSTPDIPFSGRVTNFNVQDEANIFVQFEITNEGDTAAKGECTLRAEDASGTVGFDIFASKDPVAPGETRALAGSLRIEDEGAFRVRRVVARDCGSA